MRLNCLATVMISVGPSSAARAVLSPRICFTAVATIEEIGRSIFLITNVAAPIAAAKTKKNDRHIEYCDIASAGRDCPHRDFRNHMPVRTLHAHEARYNFRPALALITNGCGRVALSIEHHLQ